MLNKQAHIIQSIVRYRDLPESQCHTKLLCKVLGSMVAPWLGPSPLNMKVQGLTPGSGCSGGFPPGIGCI